MLPEPVSEGESVQLDNKQLNLVQMYADLKNDRNKFVRYLISHDHHCIDMLPKLQLLNNQSVYEALICFGRLAFWKKTIYAPQ